jgi:hypothetical protein
MIKENPNDRLTAVARSDKRRASEREGGDTERRKKHKDESEGQADHTEEFFNIELFILALQWAADGEISSSDILHLRSGCMSSLELARDVHVLYDKLPGPGLCLPLHPLYDKLLNRLLSTFDL